MTMNLDTDSMVGISRAARMLGIREDSLRELANRGTLPCVRLHNEITGYDHRMFRPSDLIAYRELRAAKLRAQLLRIDNATDLIG